MSEFSTFKYQECLLSEAQTLRLCIVYRPPNNRSHTMSQFFEEFSNLLEVFSIWSGHILITGDLNFHMDDSADRDANKLKALISSFGLEQHVKQSTHRSGHILDIVITRADDPLVSSVIAEDRGFPDHFPVFIETVLDKPQARKKTVSYRSIKRIDPVALKTAISHSHLADINSDLPLEKQVCLYDSVLGAILNEMAPLKTKTITSRTDAEWYNEQIREAKQGRRRAERRWRGSQLQVDKEIFIEHRHKVNELIDVSKRDHYHNLITSCSAQNSFSEC
jgi:hypothetical protein